MTGPARYLCPGRWRFPVPNTLQYPLERHRDVQQRWERLLQRTAAAKVYAPAPLKHLRRLKRFPLIWKHSPHASSNLRILEH